MDTYADRLKAAMDAKNVSIKQLANFLGVTYQAVRKVLLGESRGFNAENSLKTAMYLGISPDHLINGGDSDQNLIQRSDNITPVLAVKMVPVLNKVNAGMYREIIERHPEDIEYVPVYKTARQYTFALRVDGDSMTPGFPHGTVVIVQPDVEPKPNDYVIAVNGDNEATFKQLVKDGGDWYLKPRNPQWPIKPLGNAKIVGVVKGISVQVNEGDDLWPM